MKNYIFGVDIGGTSIKIGLFQNNGQLIDSWEIATNCNDQGSSILQDIADNIHQKIHQFKISKSEIEGIGVGVPGPVGADGTVFRCVNLGWGIQHIPSALKKRTGLTVCVGNDANVAALGELWKGGGIGYKNIVMITLGTGVGGGIIIDGQILPGINGAAGEVGHIHVNDNEIVSCGCGKRGCLEQYASALGLVRLTQHYMNENPKKETTLQDIKNMTAKDIFNEAKNNDCVALYMIDQITLILGKALSQISCVCDPEAFVIGGGMSNAGDILLDNIKKHYVEYAFHSCRNVHFTKAKLGNKAGIYGGAKLIIDNENRRKIG